MNYNKLKSKIYNFICKSRTYEGNLFLFYDYLPNVTCGGFQAAECDYILKNIEESYNFSLMHAKNRFKFREIAESYYEME